MAIDVSSTVAWAPGRASLGGLAAAAPAARYLLRTAQPGDSATRRRRIGEPKFAECRQDLGRSHDSVRPAGIDGIPEPERKPTAVALLAILKKPHPFFDRPVDPRGQSTAPPGGGFCRQDADPSLSS